jgi:NitT/TauT family transport system ATP-binding protein
MDEPFSALDIQTRQLMENELLELWARASARPGGAVHHARPGRGHRAVRPRGGAVRRAGHAPHRRVRDRPAAPARRGRDPQPAALRRPARAIWAVLRDEVLKGYDQQKRKAA